MKLSSQRDMVVERSYSNQDPSSALRCAIAAMRYTRGRVGDVCKVILVCSQPCNSVMCINALVTWRTLS